MVFAFISAKTKRRYRRVRRLGLERGDNLFLSTSNTSTPLC